MELLAALTRCSREGGRLAGGMSGSDWESENDIELVSDDECEAENERLAAEGVDAGITRPIELNAQTASRRSSFERRRAALSEASGAAERRRRALHQRPELRRYRRGKFSKAELDRLAASVTDWCLRTAPPGGDATKADAHARLFEITATTKRHDGSSPWQQIQQDLPERRISSLIAAAHRHLREWKTGKWDAAEQALLVDLVTACGGGEPTETGGKGKGTNWAAISEELGRYRHSVRDKWKQMLQTGHKPNKWSQEETSKLQTCVQALAVAASVLLVLCINASLTQ